jgi:hypothetical protein
VRGQQGDRHDQVAEFPQREHGLLAHHSRARLPHRRRWLLQLLECPLMVDQLVERLERQRGLGHSMRTALDQQVRLQQVRLRRPLPRRSHQVLSTRWSICARRKAAGRWRR